MSPIKHHITVPVQWGQHHVPDNVQQFVKIAVGTASRPPDCLFLWVFSLLKAQPHSCFVNLPNHRVQLGFPFLCRVREHL